MRESGEGVVSCCCFCVCQIMLMDVDGGDDDWGFVDGCWALGL